MEDNDGLDDHRSNGKVPTKKLTTPLSDRTNTTTRDGVGRVNPEGVAYYNNLINYLLQKGYDVFLGNLHGLVSREHVDKNISSYKYWGYSVNEHGTKDMPSIIEEIHKIKTSELGKSQCLSGEETEDQNGGKRSLEIEKISPASFVLYVIAWVVRFC